MTFTDKAEHIVDLVAAVVGRKFHVGPVLGTIRLVDSVRTACPLCAMMNKLGTAKRGALYPATQRERDEGGTVTYAAHRYVGGVKDKEWARFICAADNDTEDPDFSASLRAYMVEQLCIT